MDRQELMALGARLKTVLCEVMPEQSVTAKVGFYVDSGVMTLSFHILPPGGLGVGEVE